MSYDESLYRIIASRSLAVNSVGGAAASTLALSSQTYAVDLFFPAAINSTAGCRFSISDLGAPAVSSTTGPLMPANWPVRYKCTPGQIVQALSNDASVIPSLSIIELSK